ncbi:MAG: hypothetical protein RIC03_03190 [Cyclobacteriaceae bacterium]
MSPTAKSVFVVGWYLIAEGLLLMFSNNWFLEFLGLPETESVWRIITGFVVFALGYYYIRNALTNQSDFFRFTVHIRIAQFLFFSTLWFINIGNATLILFALVELSAGLWTLFLIKKQTSSTSP